MDQRPIHRDTAPGAGAAGGAAYLGVLLQSQLGCAVRAAARLHRAGHAHSVECWRGTELAGGLYGVAIGRVFFGESMFSRAPDASKIAIAHLCTLGFELIDCQIPSAHLTRLGAVDMRRQRFLALLDALCEASRPCAFGDRRRTGAGP